MFFNSLNKKLKKMYTGLNPAFKNEIFPNGEKEFVYVGTMIDALFKGRDITKVIQIYASAYTYYGLEMGNASKTYVYVNKKATGILDSEETATLVGLVMLNKTSAKNFDINPIEEVNKYKGYVTQYLDTVINISKNKEIFATKKEEAGTVDNPILVDGIKGAHEYIESIDFKTDEIKYWKSTSLSLTDNATQIEYIIDEYTIMNSETETEITKLWFNIYGTGNCDIAPEGYKFK